MTKSLKISVIIPAYNSASYIEQCINSALNQTIPIFEIIVINDGSTDATEEISLRIEEKSKNNTIIKIINQANGGPSKARNRGIKESKGDWIAFLDADDRWLPEKIEQQVSILYDNPNCKIIGTPIFSYRKKIFYKKISFEEMLFKNYFFTSSVLVKKDLLSDISFDEKKKYSEDYKLWLQIIKRNEGIIMYQELVVYAENQNRYKRKSLSNCLWKMEKAELSNFYYLLKEESINIITFIIISLFSLMKFFKRVLSSSSHF